MHETVPFAVTFDDHEVSGNWASDIPEVGDWADAPPEAFRRRRARAFRSYWEHMPLRDAQRPDGPDMRLHRRLHWGQLATINLLDTRQFRRDQLDEADCPDADCAEAWGRNRPMLGGDQMHWLRKGLRHSTSTWDLVAQQVPFFEDPDLDFEGDKWDGYRRARQRVLKTLRRHRRVNAVVLSGDTHQYRAADLKADFRDPDSATVGVEFGTSSITSSRDQVGDEPETARHDPDPKNPHVRFKGTGRGYSVLKVGPHRVRGEFRVVDTVLRKTSGVRTLASFVTRKKGDGGLDPDG